MSHGGPAAQVVRSKNPKLVRIIRSDATVVVVEHPLVSGDTLTGWVAGAEPAERIRIAIGDIDTVERWRNETAFAVFATLVIGTLLFFTIFPVWGAGG
ncbi:MAG TPA: hypothetical protein VHG52_06225 [Thermomicrobiales bacterium]|nr:hypothetical protein [Thermomicrobiales bacterium]